MTKEKEQKLIKLLTPLVKKTLNEKQILNEYSGTAYILYDKFDMIRKKLLKLGSSNHEYNQGVSDAIDEAKKIVKEIVE